MGRGGLLRLIMNYQPCGKETKYGPTIDFSTVSETERDHEA